MRPTADQKAIIRRTKRALLRLLPPRFRKIRVEVCRSIQDNAGVVWERRDKTKGLTLQVLGTVDDITFEDTLVHEFAHILTWGMKKEPEGDHGPIWGICYARLYRQLYEPRRRRRT